MFDFRRAIAYCMGYSLSKHKMTKYAKILGSWPLGTPVYACESGLRNNLNYIFNLPFSLDRTNAIIYCFTC